jgi:hypothetical protein
VKPKTGLRAGSLVTALLKWCRPAYDVKDALLRHGWRDWGDVCAEDWTANDQALAGGSRVLSAYHDRAGVKFWIITEADRRATTILLPADY